jgi:hypothetical protein
MTIFSGLFAVFTRLLGGIARVTVGWALVLLVGRVPESKQGLVSSIGLASLIWITAVIAVIVPVAGDALVSAIPRPGFVDISWLQVTLLLLAILLPVAIGLATVYAMDEKARPTGAALAGQVLRGYPYAAVLAATIILLAGLRLVRRLRSLQRGWESEHLAIMVKPGRYAAVADDVEAALRDAGLPVERKRAPRAVELPPKLIAMVAGSERDIPERLEAFDHDGLGVLVYPSDIALLGPGELVARARSAIVRRLAFTDAYLTTAKESEQVEDQLAAISRRRNVSAADFKSIDETLTSLEVPYDDWETLYRLRLQVENETRLGGTRAAVTEG